LNGIHLIADWFSKQYVPDLTESDAEFEGRKCG
jgi:hypothetical protein